MTRLGDRTDDGDEELGLRGARVLLDLRDATQSEERYGSDGQPSRLGDDGVRELVRQQTDEKQQRRHHGRHPDDRRAPVGLGAAKMCLQRQRDQGGNDEPAIVQRNWDPADTSESDAGGHDVCRRSVTHICPATDTATGSVSAVLYPAGKPADYRTKGARSTDRGRPASSSVATATRKHATVWVLDCFSSFVDPVSSEVSSFDHAAQSAPEVRRARVPVV